MVKIIYLVMCVFPMLSSSLLAKTETITQTVRQPSIMYLNTDQLRVLLRAKSRQLILKQTSVYLQTVEDVHDALRSTENLVPLAFWLLKANTSQERDYVDGNESGIESISNAELETKDIGSRIKKFLKEYDFFQMLKKCIRYESDLLVQIRDLKKDIHSEDGRTVRSSGLCCEESIKRELENRIKSLLAIDFQLAAFNLWENGSYADNKLAIEKLNRAILYDPNSFVAYAGRGLAYYYMGKNYYQQAIDDFSHAICIDSDDSILYFFRGNAYSAIGLEHEAICDYSQAINLNPNYAQAYAKRGNLCLQMNKQMGLEDFDQAIQLAPELAEPYIDRGIEYIKLGEVERGCADLKRACELGSCRIYKGYQENGVCGQ